MSEKSTRSRAEESYVSTSERANDELRLLQRALSSIQSGVMITDATATNDPLVFVNHAFELITGYTSEEILGHNPRFLQANDKDQLALNDLRAARASDNDNIEWTGVLRNYRKDGTPFWSELSVSAVRGEEGQATHHIGIISDVTGRKEAEDRLRLLESVAVHANDAVLITEDWPFEEPGPKIAYANEAFCHMTGYAPEEVVGETPRLLQGSKTDRSRLDEIRRSLSEWEPVKVELLNYRKDGSEFWVELNITPVADEEGRITHWVSVQRETTERRRAEDLLRLQGRAISESTNAIVITDPNREDNPIVYVNPAFEHDTGYEAGAVIGHNPRFLQGDDRDQPAVEELRAAVREEREYQGVLRNYRKNGELFWNEVNIYPVRDADGRLLNYVGVQNDITERKRIEEELEESYDLLQSVMEGTTDAVFVKDLQGRYLMINQAGAEALGKNVDEVIGRDDTELFDVEDGREVMGEDQEILTAGETRTTEDTKTAEGQTRTFLSTKTTDA